LRFVLENGPLFVFGGFLRYNFLIMRKYDFQYIEKKWPAFASSFVPTPPKPASGGRRLGKTSEDKKATAGKQKE
jgi:hypothetical protein